MNVLELFAGSRSIGKEAESMGMNVFSVDWKDYKDINLVVDVEFLKISDIPFVPDIIWASPDCTTYSIAGLRKHRNGTKAKSEYAEKCDRVNVHYISLIKKWLEINPNLKFYIENPRGMMRKMPFMQEFDRHTIWYCQYGNRTAKPTDIWTNNSNWIPKPVCHNGNKNCHHEPAPRGSQAGTSARSNSYYRSIIPVELCKAVLEACVNPK
jgi:site-specific DNA-cytosine methylase